MWRGIYYLFRGLVHFFNYIWNIAGVLSSCLVEDYNITMYMITGKSENGLVPWQAEQTVTFSKRLWKSIWPWEKKKPEIEWLTANNGIEFRRVVHGANVDLISRDGKFLTADHWGNIGEPIETDDEPPEEWHIDDNKMVEGERKLTKEEEYAYLGRNLIDGPMYEINSDGMMVELSESKKKPYVDMEYKMIRKYIDRLKIGQVELESEIEDRAQELLSLKEQVKLINNKRPKKPVPRPISLNTCEG